MGEGLRKCERCGYYDLGTRDMAHVCVTKNESLVLRKALRNNITVVEDPEITRLRSELAAANAVIDACEAAFNEGEETHDGDSYWLSIPLDAANSATDAIEAHKEGRK